MSIKSITSLFFAFCAVSVLTANTFADNSDPRGYIEITQDTTVSQLPEHSPTEEYRIMNGVTLTVDKTSTITTALRTQGEDGSVTSTICFTADDTAEQVLTSITATNFWAGTQPTTPDWHTTIQITLDEAGAQALQNALAGGGTYEQDLLIADEDGYVNECTYNWSKFALTGNFGWTVVADVQDADTYVVQEGEIALIGYDKEIRGGGDYTSYSRLALVANGKPSVTPEPSVTLTMLLTLIPFASRRRRQADK